MSLVAVLIGRITFLSFKSDNYAVIKSKSFYTEQIFVLEIRFYSYICGTAM